MNHALKVHEELKPRGLNGISEEQISQHWSLYEGYIKSVNALNEKLAALAHKGDFGPEFAELKRRLGYEMNGVILHEHYFRVLKAGQKPLGEGSELKKNLKKCFGGFETWKKEFVAMGKMRGVGWVILYYDPEHQTLSNQWITLHEEGHPAGFLPILVMDVWEHAYAIDGGVNGRAGCVEAFLKNINWQHVELVLQSAQRLATQVPTAVAFAAE